MKKYFKFMILALVAMCGFASCSEECDHEFIEHDFTQDIVGTWTSLNGELAEAMVIKEDGTFTTTGVMKGGSLYEEKGSIKVVNNKVTLAFDGDKETFEGRLEFVAGKSLSLVMFDDNDSTFLLVQSTTFHNTCCGKRTIGLDDHSLCLTFFHISPSTYDILGEIVLNKIVVAVF